MNLEKFYKLKILLSLGLFLGGYASVSQASCRAFIGTSLKALKLVSFDPPGLVWANTQGLQPLGEEFILKIQSTLRWGSKDLQDSLPLWPMLSHFNLLQAVIQRTSLTASEISRIFGWPEEIIYFWLGRPQFVFENGLFSIKH